MLFRRSSLLLLAALLTGCPNAGTIPLNRFPNGELGGAPLIGNDVGGLRGTSTLPAALLSADGTHIVTNAGRLIGNDSAGLIGNDVGGMVAAGAGNLVGNDGASLIGNDSAGLIGNDSGGYKLAQVPVGAPLRRAFLTLADPAERFWVDQRSGAPFAALTGDDGAYAFDAAAGSGFPAGKDVLVTALVDATYRLSGYVVPGADARLDLDLASTLCTEALRADAARTGKSLGAYDAGRFRASIDALRAAMDAGAIRPVRRLLGADGKAHDVGVFDLRVDQAAALRGQFAIAASAAPPDAAPIKALSDAWLALTGERPSGVTTVLGNGDSPAVQAAPNQGLAEGDGKPAGLVPLGGPAGIAVGPGGEVFVAANGDERGRNHPGATIRRLGPDGQVSSVWLGAEGPTPIRTAGDLQHLGDALLLSDPENGRVWRVALAGRTPATPVIGAPLPAEHGGPEDPPTAARGPKLSSWRLSEEGPRADRRGRPIPEPARFAHVSDVSTTMVDELGNIYLADAGNMRIRMIPSARGAGLAFGYREPLDDDGDGAPDGFGEPAALQAGCMYTIVGNPAWDPDADPAAPNDAWLAGYSGDGGPAQEAEIEQVTAMAWSGGALYFADGLNHVVRRVDRATGTITTFAKGLERPTALTVDPRGRLVVAEKGGIFKLLDADGRATAIAGRAAGAGGRAEGWVGDGDARHGADLGFVWTIRGDAQGNLLVSDSAGSRLRKIWRPWD